MPVYILLGAFSLDTLNCMFLEVRENTRGIREIARDSGCCNIAFGIRARDKSRERNTVLIRKGSLYFLLRHLRVFWRTNRSVL